MSFLTNIDFSQIDEMDPNLFNGHKVIFESDIELEIRLIEDIGRLLVRYIFQSQREKRRRSNSK